MGGTLLKGKPNPKMRNMTINMPEIWTRYMDYLVDCGLFYSRSDLVRQAVYLFIMTNVGSMEKIMMIEEKYQKIFKNIKGMWELIKDSNLK